MLKDLRVTMDNYNIAILALFELLLFFCSFGLELFKFLLAPCDHIRILFLNHRLHHEVDLQIRVALLKDLCLA